MDVAPLFRRRDAKPGKVSYETSYNSEHSAFVHVNFEVSNAAKRQSARGQPPVQGRAGSRPTGRRPMAHPLCGPEPMRSSAPGRIRRKVVGQRRRKEPAETAPARSISVPSEPNPGRFRLCPDGGAARVAETQAPGSTGKSPDRADVSANRDLIPGLGRGGAAPRDGESGLNQPPGEDEVLITMGPCMPCDG